MIAEQSEIDVCNLALGLLGGDAITAFDEGSTSADRLKLVFKPVRNVVLRLHPWSFALARASLATVTPPPAFGFATQFRLPDDFLRLKSLNEVDCWRPTDAYAREGDLLLCNETVALIRYVRLQADMTRWDPLAYDVLAKRLAWEIAYRVTGSGSMEQLMEERFKTALRDARGVNAQEQGPEPEEPPASWDQARL